MANREPKTTTLRQKVYDVIDGEREYQDETFPSSPAKTLTDYTNLLIEYTDKLAADLVAGKLSSPTGGVFKRLREVAAIAVHAMEVHGVTPRENHVPLSAGITGTMHVVGKADALAPPTPKPVPDHAAEDAAKIAALKTAGLTTEAERATQDAAKVAQHPAPAAIAAAPVAAPAPSPATAAAPAPEHTARAGAPGGGLPHPAPHPQGPAQAPIPLKEQVAVPHTTQHPHEEKK